MDMVGASDEYPLESLKDRFAAKFIPLQVEIQLES